ncbi:MAG: helix-turn-helix domain-containing protein, partial [Arachnia sp.]
MAARRSYGSYNDGCASAHALDLIGERWALIVVRELLLGPKRFVDIQRDIPGIGPAPLSQRLQDLEDAGVVVRVTLPEPARVVVYDLTEWGH